ncbi:MAG: indolepyruvate ferredoxin oxidoreductase subunit alpha [Treponema sp.]|nr:indolepyruvate ferredoxin oxidoreductase subunit alpha [Treponema sp.]
MAKQMIMGNQAIALGALKAGVNLASGYPGTPSSEIIEFISKYKEKTGTYVEWSVNEKAAVEVAAGVSYAGGRTLVTMKQVGLNVASDPVMCLSYVGVKGGMVIVSADDPGPISSQTEQDTRTFAQFSKLPCLDPSTPYEAFTMVQEAFELSEKYNTPVLLRPTTRVDHAYESMEIPELPLCKKDESFTKDSARWVIFPLSSFKNHKRIFERNEKILPDYFSKSTVNVVENSEAKGLSFAAGGISYCYLKEALAVLSSEYPELKDCAVMKIGTPYPFPEKLAEQFLNLHPEIIVFEELDPVIEDALVLLSGKKHLKTTIHGKKDGTVPEAGELSVDIVRKIVLSLLKGDSRIKSEDDSAGNHENETGNKPELPVRPPVLCAGCPHRGAFYAVKQAMKGEKTVFCGDIGCYTLGNAKPLDMTDTCLCMGADITMAQGFYHYENDRKCFSFIGDSTFFASGITGVVNAVYNQSHQTICILDNSTTAMTGHQPHPGTGVTMMGEIVDKISIPEILKAIGVKPVIEVDPFNQEKAVQAVKDAVNAEGVSAVIFKSPCISIASKLGCKLPGPKSIDTEKCIGCKKCINELGCPSLSISLTENSKGKKLVEIDKSLCTGCGLCACVCPCGAIGGKK